MLQTLQKHKKYIRIILSGEDTPSLEFSILKRKVPKNKKTFTLTFKDSCSIYLNRAIAIQFARN